MKNNSFLSSGEIIKSFLSYLDDSIYSYAYLLDGSWGSGKTFFVKEILIPSIVKHEKEKKDQDSEYKEKRILYVSLYGIKETEEISRLLYLELRKVMADKMTTGRFLKKHTPQIPTWLGTTSKIVSDVIKDSKGKYRTVRYDVSEKDYTVYDISQKTHCRRDTDLRIIVKEDLPIKWAKQIVRHVCEGYKSSSDVIWIYVGVSKEDMLLYNWRITGRWINPLWKNTGIDPLKERDGEFSWENQSGTSIISEYNEKNVYKPDDELYVYYHQIFEDSMPYIREMFSLYANDEKEKLYTWISENKEQIQEFYNKTTNGCCSRIREWNEFIKHYSLLYIELNNICLEIENRNWNPQAKWHLVGRKIHSIQKEKDVIEKGEVKWRKTPDVTDEELKKYKPCYENHRIRAFTQTIPVSEDAIEVRMEIKYEKNTEGKIIVSGKTNLFDGAQLLISITPDGKFYGPSCKVNCLNGTFTSVPLGNGTNLSGKCRLSITMPVSSVQPIEFVKKSGMQYENLKGDFIVRDGISPSGKYEQEVVL